MKWVERVQVRHTREEVLSERQKVDNPREHSEGVHICIYPGTVPKDLKCPNEPVIPLKMCFRIILSQKYI